MEEDQKKYAIGRRKYTLGKLTWAQYKAIRKIGKLIQLPLEATVSDSEHVIAVALNVMDVIVQKDVVAELLAAILSRQGSDWKPLPKWLARRRFAKIKEDTLAEILKDFFTQSPSATLTLMASSKNLAPLMQSMMTTLSQSSIASGVQDPMNSTAPTSTQTSSSKSESQTASQAK